MSNSWIQIGIVGKAHGLRGAFFMAQRDDALPLGLKHLRVGVQAETGRPLTLSQQHRAGERLVLQCLELSTRQDAEAIKALAIWCERALLSLEESSEYLWVDLIGKQVLDCEGKLFGTIQAIGNFGASDVVRVVAHDGRWTELPFVSFYFDMAFTSASPSIKLLVPAATFDDTWTQP